jgi:hypothetical protein
VPTSVAVRWVAISLLALLAAWFVAPSVVPIYDGIGQSSDEPYRYVHRPADAPGPTTSKAPTTAKATLTVQNGVSAAGYSNSAEQGPQISLYVPAGALKVPATASTVVVTAQPLAPSPPLPTDGTIVTNVYRITAVAAGKDAQLIGTGNHAPTIQMRAPTGKQPGPVFERRTGSGWQQVQTIRTGIDTYQAQAQGFGDWALVQVKGTGSTGGGGGINVGLLAGGIAVLVLAGIIAAVRTIRLRAVAR